VISDHSRVRTGFPPSAGGPHNVPFVVWGFLLSTGVPQVGARPFGVNLGGWPIFALHHFHGPILAFFARVGGDAAGATLLRSTPPFAYAVVVLALFAHAKDGVPASVVASVV